MLVTQPCFSWPERCSMPCSIMFSKKARGEVFSKVTIAWGPGGHQSVDGKRLLVHHSVGFFPCFFPLSLTKLSISQPTRLFVFYSLLPFWFSPPSHWGKWVSSWVRAHLLVRVSSPQLGEDDIGQQREASSAHKVMMLFQHPPCLQPKEVRNHTVG